MVAQLKTESKNLYETDYNLWVLETVKKLENRDLDSLDWENLIEEVSDLSKRDKRKLQNLLKRLCEHLLKLKYWQSEIERNKRHWRGEITNFRQQIQYQLEDSPSLKPYLTEIYTQCYQDGRQIASQKSGLPLNTFPEKPIAPLEQILDENWLP
jgi:mRNA-degrading endonuclease RelE of RelBE toxin-antitoxin system